MNLSTEGMNIIEARSELYKLAEQLYNQGRHEAAKALLIAVKIIDKVIADNAIKNVKFD